MIKVAKPKIDISSKKLIKPAKVKINLHGEYTLDDAIKLVDQIQHCIAVGHVLNDAHK